MANVDSNSDDRRGTSSFKGGRAIANKSVPKREGPETNLRRSPALIPEVEGQRYRAVGLNISKDFSAKSLDLSPVAKAYKAAPPGSTVLITGSESPSVIKGPPGLPRRRAQSARDELIKMGVPRDAIRTQESPPSLEDPRYISADIKASMRGARLEVVPPQNVPRPATGFTDGTTFVKGVPGTQFWPPKFDWRPKLPIDWPPIIRRPRRPLGGGENDDRRKHRDYDSPWLRRMMGAGVLAFLISEYLESAVAGYMGEKLSEEIKKKIDKSLEEMGDKAARKLGIVRIDIGKYNFPPKIRAEIKMKYMFANLLIQTTGDGKYVRSLSERTRRQFLKQWMKDEGVSEEEAREELEPFELDETLSLQFGGSFQPENQDMIPGRLNNALGQAERAALRRGGFQLGDPIRFIWVTELEQSDNRYKNYEWHLPRLVR